MLIMNTNNSGFKGKFTSRRTDVVGNSRKLFLLSHLHVLYSILIDNNTGLCEHFITLGVIA